LAVVFVELQVKNGAGRLVWDCAVVNLIDFLELEEAGWSNKSTARVR